MQSSISACDDYNREYGLTVVITPTPKKRNTPKKNPHKFSHKIQVQRKVYFEDDQTNEDWVNQMTFAYLIYFVSKHPYFDYLILLYIIVT